jgi:hypothetical protein
MVGWKGPEAMLRVRPGVESAASTEPAYPRMQRRLAANRVGRGGLREHDREFIDRMAKNAESCVNLQQNSVRGCKSWLLIVPVQGVAAFQNFVKKKLAET